jgi:hypothetical protein
MTLAFGNKPSRMLKAFYSGKDAAAILRVEVNCNVCQKIGKPSTFYTAYF